MRFMIIIKAKKNSEAGIMPDEKLLSDMGKFNEELVNAGVMLAGDGLHPSSKGARVEFSGANRTVVDGPFAETKELVAGFWIWEVKSKERKRSNGSSAAPIQWVKKPRSRFDRFSKPRSFGAEFTPELQEAGSAPARADRSEAVGWSAIATAAREWVHGRIETVSRWTDSRPHTVVHDRLLSGIS